MKKPTTILKKAVSLVLVLAVVVSLTALTATQSSALEVKGKTLAQVLGMDGKIYFDWLNKHSTDNYYLGTPYAPYDHRNPNGDCKGAYGASDRRGVPALNCTGFVWHALYYPTKLSGGRTGAIPAYGNRIGWYGLYAHNNVSRRTFTSKAAMLKSGYAEKGDVIWMYRYNEFTAADNNHIAIYWGNGHSDRVWHAVKKGTCFGYISPNYKLYVVLKSGAIPNYSAPKISKIENTVSGPKITWKKVTGAARYRVFIKKDNGKWKSIGDTTSNSLTYKKAKSGTRYTYTVRCVSADGTTYTSSYNKTGKTGAYYAAPSPLKAESSDGGIKFTWGASDGVNYYRVYRKGPSDDTFKVVAYVKGTSYLDTDVTTGKDYQYTVRCSNAAHKGLSAYKPAVTARYVPQPAINRAYVNSSGLVLCWDKCATAEMYRVFVKQDGKWTKLGDTKKTKFTVASPVLGEEQIYTVRCVNKAGTKYTSSYDRNGLHITCYAAPQIASLTGTEAGMVINVGDLPENTLCCILRKNDEGNWAELGDTAEPTFTDTNVEEGVEYTYSLRYVDAATGEYLSDMDSVGMTRVYTIDPPAEDPADPAPEDPPVDSTEETAPAE